MKMGNLVVRGSFESISNITIRQAAYDFLIVSHCNHVVISCHFQDITTVLPKLEGVT